LFLTLVLLTAQRSETIRNCEFADFEVRQGKVKDAPKEYWLATWAAKTGKK
jgi:hypothetical protein